MSDNKRPFINQDDIEELVVDEDELAEVGLNIETHPHRRRRRGGKRVFLPYTPERVDALLVQAGYEPVDIPRSLRRAALEVAWAWAKGVFDEDDIAAVSHQSVGKIREAARALNTSGPLLCSDCCKRGGS